MTITARDLHERWLADPAYREAYDALDDEFTLAAALIEVRSRAGLSQAELAGRMGTSQTPVARMEGGRQPPSFRTLKRVAEATGSKLRISLVPV